MVNSDTDPKKIDMSGVSFIQNYLLLYKKK